MKTILVVVALSTIATAPALAQRCSTAHHGAHAGHAARQPRLPAAAPQAPDSYYQHFPHIWTG
jgi:hypothetical protein